MSDPGAIPRKRPRINRACAACRRRKIKCDGTQPCKACITNELICSYDDDERRRNGPEYIQALEKKVEELEGLLGHGPDDLRRFSRQSSSLVRQSSGTSSTETPVQRGDLSSRQDSGLSSNETPVQRDLGNRQDSSLSSNTSSTQPSIFQSAAARTPSEAPSRDRRSEDDVLETMIGASEKPLATEERYWGHFGGLSLLQRMRKLCSAVAGMHQASRHGDSVEDDFINAFDSFAPSDSSSSSWEAFALLPTKDRLMKCIDTTLKEACCLLSFIDRPSLDEIVHHIYDSDNLEYTTEDRKSLALLFAIVAVGRRFEIDETGRDADRLTNNISKGMRYFRASRSMLDVADCHDIVSLQTVLCLIIYLQSSSMLSTCYSYICAGVAASLRMGLHVPSVLDELPPEQRQIRRRIFSVLNIMDTYATTTLGLPRTLRDVDANSVMPIPQTPSHATSEPFMLPDGPDIALTATNAHAKLIQIMARAVDISTPPLHQKNGYYGVEYRKIAATEEELDAWYKAMPKSLNYNPNEDPQILRTQLLLRLAYAHVQMVLYRPFLHHVAKGLRPFREVRYKAYACGSACVKAAMQVVWLAEALESRGLFNEASWFVALVVSFAATILMLYALSNEGDDTIQQEAHAAEKLKLLLARYSHRSLAVRRSYIFLQQLTDAKNMGRGAPYSDLPSHADDSYHEPPNPQSRPRSENEQATATDAEPRAAQEHTLQAMSYPRMHPYLDEMSNV